jgi:hypothetical protein
VTELEALKSAWEATAKAEEASCQCKPYLHHGIPEPGSFDQCCPVHGALALATSRLIAALTDALTEAQAQLEHERTESSDICIAFAATRDRLAASEAREARFESCFACGDHLESDTAIGCGDGGHNVYHLRALLSESTEAQPLVTDETASNE